MSGSLKVIFKRWLKTKTPALYIGEKGTTFNPKLRFAVFHSIAFSTKPYIIGLPSKTMFQPDNSDTRLTLILMDVFFEKNRSHNTAYLSLVTAACILIVAM